MKKSNYNIVLGAAFAALVLLGSCGEYQKSYYTVEGNTMGTTYHITYSGTKPTETKKLIDSVLATVNNSLSTYIPQSTISKFNSSDDSVAVDSFFCEVFRASKKIYSISDGAFDPTVGPLVNAWGFGFKTYGKVDTALIDSLRQFVGLDKVKIRNGYVIKSTPGVELDFSAIAKGFGVDKVCQFLDEIKIENYLVEIGGEVRSHGVNKQKGDWRVGIEKPILEMEGNFAIVSLSGKSMATSGNYRNYREENGHRFVHTINPKSGYGSMHQLLSTSVVADQCMLADGLATAIMVMGWENGKRLAEKYPWFSVFLIYENDKGQIDMYRSEELKDKAKLAA